MNHPKEKIRLLYYPFLLITVAFVIIYSFLNWWLVIDTNTIVAKEPIIEIFGPILLAWIPVLVWLRPKINLLLLKNKEGKSSNILYFLVAAFAIAAPTIIAQEYLVTSTGKLTTLATINEIDKYAPTKYYTLTKHFVTTAQPAIKYTYKVVNDKSSHYIQLSIYVACPVFDDKLTSPIFQSINNAEHSSFININTKQLIVLDGIIIDKEKLSTISSESFANVTVLKGASAIEQYGNDAANGVVIIKSKKDAIIEGLPITQQKIEVVKAWLCINYQKQISSRLSEEQEEIEKKQFGEETEQNLKKINIDSFVYLQRVGNNNNRDGYAAAIKESNILKSNAVPIILEPMLTPFSERNGNRLLWIFGAFIIGAAVWLLIIFIPKFNEDKLNGFLNGTLKKEKINIDGLQFFILKQGFYVTPFIMFANIIVFTIMVCCGLGFISFNGYNLLKWGANYGPFTVNGQWWRLLTSTFLHGGVMHLLSNMYGLLFAGYFLEPKLKKSTYALLYIATGIFASLASLWWHNATISVGASGAIFGLYGALLALLLMKIFPPALSKPFLISTTIFVIYNLIMGIAGNGIDNAAHIGGLVSGFAIGLFLAGSIKREAIS